MITCARKNLERSVNHVRGYTKELRRMLQRGFYDLFTIATDNVYHIDALAE